MANLAWMSLRSLASGASGNIAPSQRCTSGGLARGLVISERAVTHLLHRYEELVSLHITDRERIAARLQEQGQVILALDGLQPDVGHEVLWVVRDCFSEEILLARPLLSSTQGDITALLQEVKRLLEPLKIPIKGIISDGEETIRNAVAFVFPGVAHQLCQFHYLKDAIKPFYEADRHAKTLLKKQLRGVRPLTKGLQATAELWPPLEQVYRFLDQAKTILANELQDTGQQVRERYLAHLARMRDDLPVLGQLSEAFEHFCHITDNFAAGLFRCYDIAGMPRTNNDLERCFGVARVHERRATGRRGAIPGVVVRGSVRVMASVTSKEQVFSVEELRPKDYQRWRDLRRQLRQREEARRQQWRFRKHPATYLAEVEARLLVNPDRQWD
jgi:MULE transposase domain